MTQWKQSCRWVLVAALALQFSGCAQTSRFVSRWTGRDKEDEQLAELDGRDDAKKFEKSKDKVKVASGADAAKKRKKETLPKDESLAAQPKSKQPADDRVAQASKKTRSPQDPFLEESDERPLKRRSRPTVAEDVASTDDLPRRKSESVVTDDEDLESAITVAGTKSRQPVVAEKVVAEKVAAEKAADNVREVSHIERKDLLEPEWAREDSVAELTPDVADIPDRGEIPETNAVAEPEDSVSKKLARLQPSQASHLQLCPDAQGDVRELVRGLDEDNLEHVRKSLHRLGRIGSDAVAALPALQQLLTHQDGAVRIHAALAICRIEGVSPAVLETLTQELQSDDPGQRSFAAAVIAELGPQSVDALPALAAALKDDDAYVRLHVAEVLIRHDDWSETALQTLLACLEEKDENVRWLATYSLAELAPQSDKAVDSLAEMLDDSSAKVRIGAVYALGEIGQISQPVALDLRRLDHDPNPELRSAVAFALEQIEAPVDTKTH